MTDGEFMEAINEDNEDAMDVEHVAHEVEQNFLGNVNHSSEGLGASSLAWAT